MKKNILFTLIALFCAIYAQAEIVKIGNLYYSLFDNTNNPVATVVSTPASSSTGYYEKYSGWISIPSTVSYARQTYKVTKINSAAFRGCNKITSVSISSDYITRIESNTFEGCSGLSSITIPYNVTTIGSEAFLGCTGLSSITIPKNVTSIGYSAFSGCTGITSIVVEKGNPEYDSPDNCNAVIRKSDKTLIVGCKKTIIPSDITGIERGAFGGCTYLTSITIPDSVKFLSGFNDCTNLTSIHIPNGVTSIGNYAFSGCSSLTSITIPDSVTSIGNYAFSGCSGLTSVTIGNNVTSIGEDAFSKCSNLTSIIIPDKVTRIEEDAFSNCKSLASITVGKNVGHFGRAFSNGCSSLSTVVWNAKKCGCSGDSPFYDRYFSGGNWVTRYDLCDQITSFTFGDEVEIIPNKLCHRLKNLTSINIPNSVTSIGEEAFSGCSGLTSVTIGNNVTSIGEYAFSGCTALTSIAIPNSVTSFGNYAFSGCTGLTTIPLGKNITNIGKYVFNGCTGLTSITIPDRLTSIEQYAFKDCTGLTSVSIGEGMTDIQEDAFLGCTNLTSVNWNAKKCEYIYIWYHGVPYRCDTTYLARSPFEDAKKNITSFTIGTKVETIPRYLCEGMEKLTSITIPENVTSIKDSVFKGCANLSSVNWNAKAYQNERPFSNIEGQIISFTFGNQVKQIPAYLCYGMNKLTSITIPNSVTNIERYAFSGCTSLTSVTIPNSVTSIGGSVFDGCTSLTSITIPNSVTNIERYAFSGCTSLTSITIPNSVTNIERYAFSGCTSLTSVTIPNSVTSIGGSVFDGCTSLTSITIPNSVTSIGSSAFNGCIGLTSVTIPNSVTDIGSKAFIGCTGLTSAIIDATTIHYYAFNGCTGLKYLALGNKVDSIGEYAFRDCPNMDSIRISAVLPPKVDTTYSWSEYVFDYDVCGKAILSVPCGSKKAYQNAPCWKNFKNIIEPASIYNMKVLSSNTRYGTAIITQSISACNDEAIITANPYNSYYHFVQWNDGNTDNPRTVIVTQDTTFTAEFAPNQYTITASGEHGTVEGTGTYDYNTKVYLTAVPDKGYHFVKWNNGKTYNPYYIYVRSDTTLTATFALNQYTITTYAQNGNVSGGGTYDYGTTATLTATADAHYHFTQWSDGNTDNPRTVAVEDNATYTAEFKPDSYTIIVSAGEHGNVNGGGTYDYGTTATLTATANEHYHFTQWSDGNTDNPRTITVEGDATYTAEFAIDQYTITATCDPQQGMVTGAGTYDYGTQVTLTAVSNKGYEFAQWSNGVTDNPYLLTATADLTLEAQFIPATAVDNVSADGTTPQKIIRDGQVYILRNGKTYTTTGIEVK